MRPVSYLPVALLFLAYAVPSNAQSSEAPADSRFDVSDAPLLLYELRHNVTFDCSGLTDDKSAHLIWRKNGTLVEEIGELKDRFALSAVEGVPRALFHVQRAREEDFGNYTCGLAGGPTRAWRLHAVSVAKVSANTNVVEGQKLKITCKLMGRPYPEVKWLYSNESDNGSFVELSPVEERVTVTVGADGGASSELVLAKAERADAGWYRCAPLGGHNATTTLRVKDMYAALWPFLGICAEVFVLCAIILVYEKRRTKPELDDSDTDNHDQKKS